MEEGGEQGVAHHINFVLIHHDASTQEESKHKFVLLK